LLRHVATAQRRFVDLDDLEVRQRAQSDPVHFARELTLPLAIDEIQYAPALLSPIKQLADRQPPPGSIWLTGSQSFEVMAGVSETLAGRVAILSLLGLSDRERNNAESSVAGHVTPQSYFRALLGSTFPRLYGVDDEQSRSIFRATSRRTSGGTSESCRGSKSGASSSCSSRRVPSEPPR
jgi:predicted AAA+ superfamily ATPase